MSCRATSRVRTSRFGPGPQDPAGLTNRLYTASNRFRDRSHVQLIGEAVSAGERVFVVAGSAHAVMQEPALRARFDRRRAGMGLGPWLEYDRRMAVEQGREPFEEPRGTE